MHLTGHEAFKFSELVPIYNWIYPIGGRSSRQFRGVSATGAFNEIGAARSRALYVHIPFCETICSFCPFVRSVEHDNEVVEAYVGALIREIEMKGRIATLASVSVGAVFFGGGTPSFLSPDQIRRVGSALADNFDLSDCREFSFEFEVKSATDDRIAAARDIGVTHARFGAQTFSPEYRALFRLTATVEQLVSAAGRLSSAFPHVSCDVLFGMHGQTADEIADDVEAASSLGLNNLDFYPINNVVTQPRLHQYLREAGRRPTTSLTKYYMALYVRALLRERSFLPHNGHGYVRCPVDEVERNPVVTDRYSFVYHEHTLGYAGYDLLGFGVNAISSFHGFTMTNTPSRRAYVDTVSGGDLPVAVFEHSSAMDACRPLALGLPYHGSVPIAWLDWSLIPDDVRRRYDGSIAHGLVAESDGQARLTRVGWEWYSNLMYYLLPTEERSALQRLTSQGSADPRRDIEASGLEGLDVGVAEWIA